MQFLHTLWRDWISSSEPTHHEVTRRYREIRQGADAWEPDLASILTIALLVLLGFLAGFATGAWVLLPTP